jgi:hypothetical protein
MERDNPELTDGAYFGPSRGHLFPAWAQRVGMPRGYGYGASMGAWILDYLAGWAGEWGQVVHSATPPYRSPAFTGDATFMTGTVIDKLLDAERSQSGAGRLQDERPERHHHGDRESGSGVADESEEQESRYAGENYLGVDRQTKT